jgi:hypothetical protein
MNRRYLEIVIDAVLAGTFYHFLGWIGFALFAFVALSWFLLQLIDAQNVTMKTLLSRLPDRCAVCHREIVDEGGVFDEHGIYHAACSDKLESLEELRKQAGVPASQAIHKPRLRHP